MIGTILILAKFIVAGCVIGLISRWRLLAPDLVQLVQNHYQTNSEIGTTQTAPIFILEPLVSFSFLGQGSLNSKGVSGCLR